MRRASDASVEQLAARLNTSVSTIQALEAGAIEALPDWQETTRVVTTYAGSLGLDSRPVLRRMKAHLAGPAPGPRTERDQPVHVQQTSGLTASPAPRRGPPAEESTRPAEAPAGAREVSGTARPTPEPVQSATMPTAPGPQPAHEAPPVAGPPRPPIAGVQADAVAAPDTLAADTRSEPPSRAGQPSPPSEQENASATAKQARARRFPGAGTIVTWALLLVLFAFMGMGVRFAVERPQFVWSTVDSLPDPAPRLLRAAWEMVRPFKGSERKPASPDASLPKSDRLPEEPSPPGN